MKLHLLKAIFFGILISSCFSAIGDPKDYKSGDPTWVRFNVFSPTGKQLAEGILEIRHFVARYYPQLSLLSPTRTSADSPHPHVLKIRMLLKPKGYNYTTEAEYGVLLGRSSQSRSRWGIGERNHLQSIQFNWGDLVSWSDLLEAIKVGTLKAQADLSQKRSKPFAFLGFSNSGRAGFDHRSSISWTESYYEGERSQQKLSYLNDSRLFLAGPEPLKELNQFRRNQLSQGVSEALINSNNPFPYGAEALVTEGFKKPGVASFKDFSQSKGRIRIETSSITKSALTKEYVDFLIQSKTHSLAGSLCRVLFF